MTESTHVCSCCSSTEWPKISENTALYDCVTVDFNIFKLYLFFTADVDVHQSLFCSVIIFVLLFDKTAKPLVSIMVWVKETKESLILTYKFEQRQNVVLDDFVINTGM